MTAIPGWYADPAGSDGLRYYDGRQWSAMTAPRPVVIRSGVAPSAPPAYQPTSAPQPRSVDTSVPRAPGADASVSSAPGVRHKGPSGQPFYKRPKMLAAVAGVVTVAIAATVFVPGLLKSDAATSDPANSPTTRPTADSLVTRAALTARDLPAGTTVTLLPGGDEVAGQVTMDNCGYDFTMEAHRLARHQTGILMPSAPRMSNEVVAYDSSAHAIQALNQLRASVRNCKPGTIADSGVADVPALRYDTAILLGAGDLPDGDSAVISEQVTAAGSDQTVFLLQMWQRRGTVLSAVYSTGQTALSSDAQTSVRQLARITGLKLAKLPSS